MSHRHITEFTAEFGDCDPNQIVFYPNFLRWIDAASRHFFEAAGVPSWPELERSTGIVGTPVAEVSVRFLRPATCGDRIAVETTITEWRVKTFVMKHVIRRGDDVLAEGEEVRLFAQRHPDGPKRIQSVPAPEGIRRLLE
ncbi:MAG: acyl-CoA thioesterase [Betaproteobacteria bacterium]